MLPAVSAIQPYLLNIVSQLPQNIPQLHHVLRDGVEILQSAVDVAGALVQVQGVVENNFVAGEGWTCYGGNMIIFLYLCL